MALMTRPDLPPVFRLRAVETEDSYGDPVESWDEPDRKRLLYAELQPVQSDDREESDGTTTTSERLLVVPSRADVREDDRIESEGQTWRVDGVPDSRRGLATGYVTTARLVRFSGRKDP